MNTVYCTAIVCCTICFISYFIYSSNLEYDKKIRSVDKHIYILKFPSGKSFQNTVTVHEMDEEK